MKITILTFFLASAISLSANNIVIQLGVFEKPVDTAIYFPNITNVKNMQDASGFHLYYVDGINTEAESNSLISGYIEKGYSARIIDMNNVIACKTACTRQTAPKPYQDFKSNSNHYKVTKAFTPKELGDFEKIREVILNNPYSTVVLDGQASKLQCYLNMRGVSNCRMTVKDSLSSVSGPVKVWVYDEHNIALNIEQEFKAMYS